MTTALYDEISPPLIADLKTQPGFLLHVTYEDAAGSFVVGEVWESPQQPASWLDPKVKPNLPFEISQEVTALHSVHKPS